MRKQSVDICNDGRRKAIWEGLRQLQKGWRHGRASRGVDVDDGEQLAGEVSLDEVSNNTRDTATTQGQHVEETPTRPEDRLIRRDNGDAGDCRRGNGWTSNHCGSRMLTRRWRGRSNLQHRSSRSGGICARRGTNGKWNLKGVLVIREVIDEKSSKPGPEVRVRRRQQLFQIRKGVHGRGRRGSWPSARGTAGGDNVMATPRGLVGSTSTGVCFISLVGGNGCKISNK
jgi:hypothetical protein